MAYHAALFVCRRASAMSFRKLPHATGNHGLTVTVAICREVFP